MAIGRLDHAGRDRVDVAGRLDGDAGETALGEARDERIEAGRIVAKRIRGGQQQFVRLDPVEDVRHFHDVHGADRPIETGAPPTTRALDSAGSRRTSAIEMGSRHGDYRYSTAGRAVNVDISQ